MVIIIRRPSIDPFTTEQHIQALSLRNKEDYLERIKAATPVIAEIAEVKPRTWRDMKGLFRSIEVAGRSGILGNFSGRMKSAALFPLNPIMNRARFMFEQVLMPMMPIINQMTRAYEDFVKSNQTGALIGGAIGAIIGMYYGHSFAGFAIGSAFGAWVEESISSYGKNLLFAPPGGYSGNPYHPLEPGGGEDPRGDIVQDPGPAPSMPGPRRERLPDGRYVRVVDV